MRARDIAIFVVGFALIIAGCVIAMPTEDIRQILFGAAFVWAGVCTIILCGPRSS